MIKPIEVLLISSKECRYTQDTADTPPLGILYIASFLAAADFSARVIDLNSPTNDIRSLIEMVGATKTLKIVGISSTTISYNNAIRTAHLIKNRRPDIQITMGGPHVSFEYAETLSTGVVDFVIRSQGEHPFKQLCEFVLRGEGSLETIPSLVYVEGQGIKVNESPTDRIADLDELPFPDRSMVDLSSYFRPFHIMTTRGCPGNCVFCAACSLTNRKIRKRSVDNIIREIELLKDRYNASTLLIADDTFTFMGKERIAEIARYLKKRDILWSCESRVDVKDLEVFELMARNNCIDIQIGIESFDQAVLDSVEKKIKKEQIIEVLKVCKKFSISVFGNIIVGLPTDTEESFTSTMNLLFDLIKEYALSGSCSICTPFPGTDIYRNPDKHGINIIERNWDLYNMVNPVMETKHMSALKQKELHYKFFDLYTLRQSKWQLLQRNLSRYWTKLVYEKHV